MDEKDISVVYKVYVTKKKTTRDIVYSYTKRLSRIKRRRLPDWDFMYVVEIGRTYEDCGDINCRSTDYRSLQT